MRASPFPEFLINKNGEFPAETLNFLLASLLHYSLVLRAAYQSLTAGNFYEIRKSQVPLPLQQLKTTRGCGAGCIRAGAKGALTVEKGSIGWSLRVTFFKNKPLNISFEARRASLTHAFIAEPDLGVRDDTFPRLPRLFLPRCRKRPVRNRFAEEPRKRSARMLAGLGDAPPKIVGPRPPSSARPSAPSSFRRLPSASFFAPKPR